MSGTRHKANVGEVLAAELRQVTGIGSVASQLTYDLRSGEADMHDQIVATTFANCAMDLLAGGLFGRMMAIQDGKYAHTEFPRPGAGPRKVDVPKMYNVERFRPRYNGKLGETMLLVDLEEVAGRLAPRAASARPNPAPARSGSSPPPPASSPRPAPSPT